MKKHLSELIEFVRRLLIVLGICFVLSIFALSAGVFQIIEGLEPEPVAQELVLPTATPSPTATPGFLPVGVRI